MSLLYPIVLNATRFFFKCLYRHRVYGKEHFAPGGALLAGNHTSFLDPPIAAISSPEEVHFLARESLFKNPLFGAFIRKLNSHPVSGDASDIAVFKTITQLLKEGKKVVLFPEGTRSVDDRLGEIKPGIGMLVSRAQAFIIPMYIHGAFEIWGRKRKFPKLWGKTACVFGSPIYYKDFSHLDKRETNTAIAQKLFDSISALRKWYEDGAIGLPP
jgi:1-acyl-sn-glycerol-3-phosphate acyltransferase